MQSTHTTLFISLFASLNIVLAILYNSTLFYFFKTRHRWCHLIKYIRKRTTTTAKITKNTFFGGSYKNRLLLWGWNVIFCNFSGGCSPFTYMFSCSTYLSVQLSMCNPEITLTSCSRLFLVTKIGLMGRSWTKQCLCQWRSYTSSSPPSAKKVTQITADLLFQRWWHWLQEIHLIRQLMQYFFTISQEGYSVEMITQMMQTNGVLHHNVPLLYNSFWLPKI